MTEPQDIIGLVKELLQLKVSMRHIACFFVPEDETDKNVRRILENFPAIAESLLIAYGVLKNHEHLVRGECIAGCDMCDALKQIRSLSHSL